MSFLSRWVGGPEKPAETTNGDRRDLGIFAGLFVATPEQLDSWNLRGLTPSEWRSVEFKRLETVKLGTLEAILTDTTYQSIDQDQLHNALRDGGAEGPWIANVRPELVAALGNLTPESAAAAAAKWADTEEFKLDAGHGARPEDIEELAAILTEIADLVKGKQPTEALYLLMGL